MVMVTIILVPFRRSESVELAEAALEMILTIALNFYGGVAAVRHT